MPRAVLMMTIGMISQQLFSAFHFPGSLLEMTDRCSSTAKRTFQSFARHVTTDSQSQSEALRKSSATCELATSKNLLAEAFKGNEWALSFRQALRIAETSMTCYADMGLLELSHGALRLWHLPASARRPSAPNSSLQSKLLCVTHDNSIDAVAG